MNVTLRLRLPKGVSKPSAHEYIANSINKELRKRQLKGLIGLEHPFTKQEIVNWIENYCIRKKYISSADKVRKDYNWFLEITLYKTIMGKYIRKDELTKDDEEKLIENDYYYPGLIYITGIGWIITNSNALIEKYKNQRDDILDAQKDHLKQKCQDASDFVKLLTEHKQDFLSDNNRDKDVV